MKKILHVGLSSNTGGIEEYLLNLYKAIDRKEFSFDILSVSKKKIANSDVFISLGANIINIPSRKESLIKHYSSLLRLFHKNKYEIVEFHMMSYSWFEPIIIAALTSHSKIILHSHMVINKELFSTTTRFLDKIGRTLVGLLSPRLVFVACAQLAGKSFFGTKKFTVIKNGINVDKFCYSKTARQSIRSELGISIDSKIILHIGRFAPQKNHEFLIKAFVAYFNKTKNSNVNLVLVGDGELRDQIEKQASNTGLKNHIFFLGTRFDTYRIYSAADLFLLPSVQEGLAIVAVEAQSNGLPCIVSKGVSKETDITGQITYLGLNQIKQWVKSIGILMGNRYNGTTPVKKAGYDISSTSLSAMNLYNKTLESDN